MRQMKELFSEQSKTLILNKIQYKIISMPTISTSIGAVT